MRPYGSGAPNSARKGKKKKTSALRSKVAEVKAKAAKLAKREEAMSSLVEEAATPAKVSPAKLNATPKRKARMARMKSVLVGSRHSRLPDTPNTVAAKKAMATETKVKRLRKIKSLAGINNGHSKLEESPRRISRRLATKNGAEEIEQAREAIELNGNSNSGANGGNFLQRTVSKIWRRPSTEPQEHHRQPHQANGGGSCVIS